MAFPAASFVDLGCAHQDNRIIKRRRLAFDEALGATGIFAADHAYRMELADVFGTGQKFRHRAERQAAKILVKAGANDALAAVG